MKNVLENWMNKGVLVAISIPIFTAQLEKSREATDAANLRLAYAEVASVALTASKEETVGNVDVTAGTNGTWTCTYKDGVTAKQQQDGWQGVDYGTAPNEIGGQQVVASTTGWTIISTNGGDPVIAVKS